MFTINGSPLIKSKSSHCNTEVVLIVNCKPDEVETVETVLFSHLAIGIGRKL